LFAFRESSGHSVQTIHDLLKQSAAQKLRNPQDFLAWVLETNAAYRDLHRPDHSAQEIADLKLSFSFWRSRVLDALLSQSPVREGAEPHLTLRILLALNTHLSDHHRTRAAALLNAPQLAELMASQGIATPGFPEWDRHSGPGVNLDIVANRGSSWPYERWREDPLFGRYEAEQEGVRYRGVSFRPGDVLLANVNVDGNGVYTALSEPRGFSSHSGFFAVLEHDGRRLPVVIETYEKGVRPVPLSVFLGPKFCSYVEVYRNVEYTAGHAEELNRAAAGIIERVRAYNFNSEDEDPHYMSCTMLGRFMHKAAGLKPARTVSKLSHPVVQSNLARIGYTHFDYFGPVDFLLNDCFRFAGLVDNNQVAHLLARELVDREFRHQFAHSELLPDKFPFPYRLNLWGLGQIRRRTLMGKLIGLIEGFGADTLPKGPDELMAVILLVEKQIGKIIAKVRTGITPLLAELDHLDMKVLAGTEHIQQTVRESLELPWLVATDPGSKTS